MGWRRPVSDIELISSCMAFRSNARRWRDGAIFIAFVEINCIETPRYILGDGNRKAQLSKVYRELGLDYRL
jgi:hypothetical protein